jgi:isoquinoline 1-oxidoreductase subunit beta
MKKINPEPGDGFSRRDFLIRGGIVFGGSIILLQSGCAPMHRALSKMTSNYEFPSGIKEFNPTFWFQVLPDNTIRMVMPKAEMGQGIFTGFAMIAAEELDVAYEQIVVIPSSTKDPLDSFGTGGSTSTMSLYTDVREVAARMKAMLHLAAVAYWKALPEEVTAKDGTFYYAGSEMTYAKVVEVTTKWKDPGKIKLRSPADFKIIGKDVKRTDSLAKITGAPIFGIDFEFPGMVYGMFVKSPFPGGTAAHVKTEKALTIKGVQQVVNEDGLIVVIASNRYAAEMGARAIEVDWQVEKRWSQEELVDWVTVGKGDKSEVMKNGSPGSKIKAGQPGYFTAEYRTPAGSHATMEPNGAMAHYENGKVNIIAAVQAMAALPGEIAKLCGVKKEDVHIQNAFLGGGFGRKSFAQDIAKVALISKKIGKPVHIFGDRTQEFRNGYLRPPSHHKFEVMLSEGGKIEALDYQLATDNMLFSHFPKIAETMVGADLASAHGARVPYTIKHLNTTYWKTKVPYTVGPWRGVGMFSNTFAIESLMDELAAKTNSDPIDFRLLHLDAENETHTRQIAVLKRIQSEVWTTRLEENTGRGFACADDRKTIVATVAEVKIVNGKIKVTKITSAIDAGTIVNPEGVRQQVEGCAVMGMSATLMEKVELNEEGAIDVTNFHQYPVPLLSDMPEIRVILVDSEVKPLGVGEPPIAPISAAIANAVFNLTGQRLRTLPLQLEPVTVS